MTRTTALVLGLLLLLPCSGLHARTVYECLRDERLSLSTAPEPGSRCKARRVNDRKAKVPNFWGDLGPVDGITVNGGSGNNGGVMKISSREAARVGLLFLNRGNWNGKQLISAQWVDQATRVQVPATVPHGFEERSSEGPGEYGFNWWINGVKPDGKLKYPNAPPGTYCGAGHNNNYCFVIPEWNMVICRLGLDGSAGDKVWNNFLAKVGEAVIK